MKLEQQVVSLELAKKLKELGVKQESLFYWNRHKSEISWGLSQTNCSKISHWETISAFTVAELGELLPRIEQYRMKKVFIIFVSSLLVIMVTTILVAF
jgi:hypothetical protein